MKKSLYKFINGYTCGCGAIRMCIRHVIVAFAPLPRVCVSRKPFKFQSPLHHIPSTIAISLSAVGYIAIHIIHYTRIVHYICLLRIKKCLILLQSSGGFDKLCVQRASNNQYLQCAESHGGSFVFITS